MDKLNQKEKEKRKEKKELNDQKREPKTWRKRNCGFWGHWRPERVQMSPIYFEKAYRTD